MATVEQQVPPLIPGQRLTRDEFLRRWEAMPDLKFAELIGGIVYTPSPTSRNHGAVDNRVGTWLGVYSAYTPGCEPIDNATWLMGENAAPQPDTSLYVLPEYGGRSGMRGRLLAGVPEFLAEVCLSSAAHYLHEKLDLYQQEGVDEYLAVLVAEQELRWHRLVNGVYQVQPIPPDGVWRSQVFPDNGLAALRGSGWLP